MAALLISWVFAGWLSLVFGLSGIQLLASLLREKPESLYRDRPDYVLLFGFILITSLTSILTLFIPITSLVSVAFGFIGLGMTYFYRKELTNILRQLKSALVNAPFSLKIALLAVFILAMSAIVIEFGESDIWFYHSQAIKWIKEYAVVPGLGNIHGRFAFNSHFFISSAVFSLWFSEEYIVLPLNSLFFFLFTTRLIVNIHQSLQSERWPFFILNAILFLTCSFQLFELTNGTSTDAISAVFLLYAFLLFIEYTFSAKNTTTLALLWAIILTAATFKLSAIFAGFLLLFNLPLVFQKRQFPVFLGLGLLIIAPFITRNIILSGYLVYPVPSIDVLSVDWKIPMEEVVLEKELVEGWSKLPYGGADIPVEEIPEILKVPFGEWFSEWWPQKTMKWKIIMIIDSITILLMIIALYYRNYKLALVCFTVFFNLVFWFLKTPNPRFGFAFLFMGLALVLAHGFNFILESKYLKMGSWVFIPLSLLVLLSPKLKNQVVYEDEYSWSLLLIPDYYQVRSAPEVFQAKNFTVNVPPSEAPAKGIWCYNLPLPCTPYPKENLVMRGDDYQDGFRIEENDDLGLQDISATKK